MMIKPAQSMVGTLSSQVFLLRLKGNSSKSAMKMCLVSLAANSHSVTIPYNETVRFVFCAIGSQSNFSHPIYLHGHSFHVVATGYGKYNNETGFLEQSTRDITCCNHENDYDNYTCTSPQWRDGYAPNITFTQCEKIPLLR